MPDLNHADGGTSLPNVFLQIYGNKWWKMGSFQISAGMLSRPGDLCTFMDLTTARSSFKQKGSVLIYNVSAILILDSSCSSVVVVAPPGRF